MTISELTAISPVDGRYRRKVEKLDEYFSEFGLIRARVMVEVEYFIALCELPLPQLKDFDHSNFETLRNIVKDFQVADAQEIKDIEKTTNHDVKAVEYFLKKRFDAMGLERFKEFIHFGLTSQDINNSAVPYTMMQANNKLLLPELEQLVEKLNAMAEQWRDIPMLAHTHGQPASPTHLGKEIYVFVERLENQLDTLASIPFTAKFGGATGNMNAHKVAYPQMEWKEFADAFIARLGLQRQTTTTQIEHYDVMAEYFDAVKRINTILIDLSRDIWLYISMDYFKQKIKAGEVGSSAMPHKVNPIDFENAEGNLGMANAIFEHLSRKLPISRMQRDLTDSTVTRNIGVPLAHTLIAVSSLSKGLDKLILNETKLRADLQDNYAVVAEAIQTILRREQVEGAYELLKGLTRTNEKVTRESIDAFIEQLPVNETVKAEMHAVTPENYTGFNF
ncbi:MAG: adenylosuccinate lyase [bacterium]|nr:adenylosuccinate lyase [Candidatus Limimorpha caballi]MCQ2315087.1 adenylosuccinate lyase [Bacteroidales bacterium]